MRGRSADAGRFDRKPNHPADRIAEAVSLAKAAWFAPSETLLRRIPKKITVSAVAEAGCAPEIGGATLGLPNTEAVWTV